MRIVVDTSSLIHQPELLNECYPGDDIIISVVVIAELDGMKSSSSSRGASAREILRIIDAMEHSIDNCVHCYSRPCGGNIIVSHSSYPLPGDIKESNDNTIIGVALQEMDKNDDNDVILLTQDRAMSIIAESLGVATRRHESTKKVHTGEISIIEGPEGSVGDMYSQGYTYIPDHNLEVNSGVIIKEGNISALGIVENDFSIKNVRENINPCGINPVGAEQKIAVDLLYGGHCGVIEEEFLGALSGRSGSGKTTLAIAAGLQAVKDGYYDRVMVFRPSEPVGRDLGFLPGSIDEKMEPWKQAIYDVTRTLNLSDGMSIRDDDNGLFSVVPLEDVLSIENINFVRGRTFTKTFVIVDEAQNLGVTELRTLASRCGQGSAFVCTFDPSQIDNAYLKEGRAEGVERFLSNVVGNSSVWHIQLQKPVRGGVSAIVE